MSTEHKSADLVDEREAVEAEPPPRQPDVWVDDDGATRIEAFDPARLEELAAAHSLRAPSAAPTDVPPIEETPPPPQAPITPAPGLGRVVAIPPLAARNAPAVRPPVEARRSVAAAESRPKVAALASAVAPVPAPPGSDIQALIAAIDMRLEPPPAADAPTPAPSNVLPPVRAPVFEPEIGPEPTQVGAMPLISFGNTRPLVALVGEAHRASLRAVPEPQATFIASSPPRFHQDKRVRIAVVAVVVAILLLIVLLSR